MGKRGKNVCAAKVIDTANGYGGVGEVVFRSGQAVIYKMCKLQPYKSVRQLVIWRVNILVQPKL